MSRPVETLDITLLRNNKNEFVVRCQKTISIIVKQYIAKRMFSASNFEDIKQSVNVELIKRLPLIEKNYTGEVLLVTYLNVVIKNICLRIYQKEASVITPISLGEIWMLSDENADNNILFSNELERFAVALKLFRSERFKILVCIKVYFSITISSTELKQCFRGITKDDHDRVLDVFEEHYSSNDTSHNFNVLTIMLNKYDRSLFLLTEESVRRFTNMMIQKLIVLMNGNPPSRTHTKDTLKVLLEHYSELHTNNN